MEFSEWEPLYLEILEYFQFDRAADEAARDRVAILSPHDDLHLLEGLVKDRDVTVCGNAPSLAGDIPGISGVVCAADAAALVLYENGIRPEVIFTDLDGADDLFSEMNLLGTVLVVHAHGDNIPLLEEWVPRIRGPLVLTTQASPVPGVYNFGGFSDGDRAVYGVLHLGAASVRLVGFDCGDTRVNPMKRGKLFWAKRLLARIGYDC
jgi:uncharacterized Rossmann fold enzyme